MRYDRVEGAHAGLIFGRAPEQGLTWRSGLGYGLELERWSYRGEGAWKAAWGGVGLVYAVDSVPRYKSDGYSRFINGAQVLLGIDDYFDYYWSRRLRAQLYLQRPGEVEWELGLKIEKHTGLAKTTSFNLLDRDWQPRPNPLIEPGRLHAVELGWTWRGVSAVRADRQ
ncbi:MAG: hypothetical protein GKR89_00355 [Candidatus Latescibacteria bacterium]|nr:hypothetical protein [Candidatus Latescibacterota bacterium]